MSKRRKRPSGLALVTALVLVFLFAPIVVVVLNAFNNNRTLDSWGGFTARWFHEAFVDPAVRSALWVSVRVALASTAVSLAIAIPAALWTRRAGPRARALLDGTTYMRIVLPEIVAAVGLFLLFRRVNFPLGPTTIAIGHVVFSSAYATVVIQARVATLSTTLEEAARDLGARPWRAFRRVTLPLLHPAVIVAGLLVFTFSMDDVITSACLSGNTVTLPVMIFGLMRFHVTPEVNAIAAGVTVLTLVTFSLVALAMYCRIARQSRDDLYELERPARLEAIVPRELTYELDERCAPRRRRHPEPGGRAARRSAELRPAHRSRGAGGVPATRLRESGA